MNKKIELSELTVSDWLEYWAEKTPDKEYIVYSDRDLRFTWKTFNERVNNMAKGLIAIGVKRGMNVGIWAQNVPDWLTFLYATAKIGAVAVTVNTNYRTDELAFILENSDMHTLCMTDGAPGNNYTDIIYELVPELKTTKRGTFKRTLPELKTWFISDRKNTAGCIIRLKFYCSVIMWATKNFALQKTPHFKMW